MGRKSNHQRSVLLLAWMLLLCAGCSRDTRTADAGDAFTGSASCRECHEKFYTLWSTSHHGLAMQPVTETFAQQALTPQETALEIRGSRFRADVVARRVTEEGPGGTKSYPMVHVLGGKNIYYVLTPMERGRLQVLPLAYDVQKKEWFDAGASMVRHFVEGTDQALDWRDQQLTFNTACFGCHVSQLSKNYDQETDTYRTVWREPGINCESCHGPGAEHVRLCRATPTNTVLKDLKLISMKNMTMRQSDETCATCHAKMRPITTTFMPGDRFFDHFDLVTLEHQDFYPDGRDLGENYTYTLWLTSPCVQAGKLDCVHCHTSSGRYKFAGEKTNEACLPCHQKQVEQATGHTHHKADSTGNQCVSCHMPTTTFARMRRTDHSMRPPTPAATLAYKSPNACNLCHTDKDAQWADAYVRKWRARDYQAPVLYRAGLVDAAKKRDWKRLDDLLAYIGDAKSDPVFVVSLIRLLEPCDAPRKWPVIYQTLQHPHPLVRSAAANLLSGDTRQETFNGLLAAARDEYRLVRVSAASSLARYPPTLLESPAARPTCDAAFKELESALLCFPDAWNSHYNTGNYYENRGWSAKALAAYGQSMRLRPDMIPPIVNAAMLQARQGKLDAAVQLLKKAERVEP
ncbi:MAG: multiheme c-type cytochrome, partial [bacterium]